MRALFTISLLAFIPVTYSADKFEKIVIDLPGYRLLERSDFDEKLFREQLSQEELKALNREYGKTSVDLNSDGEADYLAFTYKRGEKPTKSENYIFRNVYLISCMSGRKCEVIRNLKYTVPIQYYLNSGPLEGYGV